MRGEQGFRHQPTAEAPALFAGALRACVALLRQRRNLTQLYLDGVEALLKTMKRVLEQDSTMSESAVRDLRRNMKFIQSTLPDHTFQLNTADPPFVMRKGWNSLLQVLDDE